VRADRLPTGPGPAPARRAVPPLLRLLLLGGGRAAGAALGALSAVLLARALTPAELGAWSLALAVQGYALHLGELGLRSVVTAEAGRGTVALRPLLARYLPLRLAASATVLALLGAGAALLAPDGAALLALAAGASILAAALQLDWVALADDRPGLAAALLLVRPLAFLLLLLAWPAGALTPAVAAGLFLASWLASAAASWCALRRPAAGRRPTGEPPGAAAMLRAGAPLCAVTLLNQALLSGDLLLAGVVLGAAAAGHYYVAAQVATAGLVLANAAGQAALARLARHPAGTPAFAAALAAEAAPVLACGAALTLALAAAAPALPLLFGPAQAPAVPVLLALLPWFLLQHATTLLQGALAAAGRGPAVLRANLAMLAAMVPALAVAALSGSLVLFALARGVGEAARLAALLLALPPDARRALLPARLRSARPGPPRRPPPSRSRSRPPAAA
jgi:O-antigen/teichoic acid export membrane protein